MTAKKLKQWILNRPLFALIVVILFLGTLQLVVSASTGSFNLDSVSTGVVTGLISSLATYALVRYFFLQKASYGPREWFPARASNVWVIPTYLEHSSRFPHSKYYVVPPFDAQAGTFLNQVLRRADIHYPRRKIIGSQRFHREVLRENVVTLCLPEKNQYSRILLGLYDEIYLKNQELNVAVQEDNIAAYAGDFGCERSYFGLRCQPLVSRGQQLREWQVRHFGKPAHAPGAWWQSSMNLNPEENVHQAGRINYDYALIVKGPNPINAAVSILVVCGIHGIGTFGGALFLYENVESLFEQYPARAQAHLVEIRYTTQPGGDNYLDSEILKIEHLYYLPLPDRL